MAPAAMHIVTGKWLTHPAPWHVISVSADCTLCKWLSCPYHYMRLMVRKAPVSKCITEVCRHSSFAVSAHVERAAPGAVKCSLCMKQHAQTDTVISGFERFRLLQAPLKIGNQQVTASITILEQDGMEFLFGLDMLRRYQCSIDLHKNVLRFGSINNAELPFLADHELPARLRREDSDEQAGGSGRLGGGTGAGPAPGPATHPNAGQQSALHGSSPLKIPA